MDLFRASVMGGVVGVFGMFLFGIIAYHIDFEELGILLLGIGAAVGFVTGWAAGHERDPLVGAVAAAITGVAVIGGTLVAARLDGRDADAQWRGEHSLFTYADNMAFWAMMEGRELEWPHGWSYATATQLSQLPPEIRERAEEDWASMSIEELAHHAEFSGVHDVRILVARAEEIERVWREREYELAPPPGDPDDPHTPPWELVPEEVWQATLDEWASLDEGQRVQRRERQLAVVELMRNREVGRARASTMFTLLDGAFVLMAMSIAFYLALGDFEDD